ncbi:hypothetical protein CK222_31260 [Mesorhizobium sp. WSM3866]|nr:hypothetical protein CK222_31260 [Mesorhizobium sp. WSM3866]
MTHGIEQCGDDLGRRLSAYEAANKRICTSFPVLAGKTILYDRTPEDFSDDVKVKSGNEVRRALSHDLLVELSSF